MMAFLTYYLLKNPETLRKLQAEVDRVAEGRPIQITDLSKMTYLTG
jgi:cytochrome P450 / NADPH-cytochrome P450 reductase